MKMIHKALAMIVALTLLMTSISADVYGNALGEPAVKTNAATPADSDAADMETAAPGVEPTGEPSSSPDVTPGMEVTASPSARESTEKPQDTLEPAATPAESGGDGAQEPSAHPEPLIYEAYGEGLRVTGCEPGTQSAVVPDRYRGVPVLAVGTGAFEGCEALSSVVVSEGVMEIERGAFSHCLALCSVRLPASVSVIDEGAFANCPLLTIVAPDGSSAFAYARAHGLAGESLLVGEGLLDAPMRSGETGDGLLYEVDEQAGAVAITGCTSTVDSVVIPETIEELPVTSVGESAFRDRGTLKSVTMPSTLTRIGKWAFMDCAVLTDINLPASLTEIGESAFNGCRALTSVTLPNGVASLGIDVFANCGGLVTASLGTSLTALPRDAFRDCGALQSVDLPGTLTSIGDYAFYGCAKLAVPTLPEGLTSIGGSAFQGCSAFEEIDLAEGVTALSPSAFANCGGLRKVTLRGGLTAVPAGAFAGCTALKRVVIEGIVPVFAAGALNAGAVTVEFGADILEIPESVFRGNVGVKALQFDGPVTRIGKWAFMDCAALTDINLPASLTEIGESSFNGCRALTSVTLPNGVASLGIDVFANCGGLVTASLGTSLTTLPRDAFRDCGALQSVDLPGTLTSVGDYAFCGCAKLAVPTLPEGLKRIGVSAFQGCSALTEIDLSEGVTTLGASAFANCDGLRKVTLRGGLAAMPAGAFAGCTALKRVVIEGIVPMFAAGALNAGAVTVEFGADILEIPESAFRGSIGVKALQFDGPVTRIGKWAFMDCAALTDINLPASLTEIGESAFNGCRALTSVTLPNGVASLGIDVFANCGGLVAASLGTSLTTLPRDAFRDCGALRSVDLPGTLITVGDYAFCGCAKLVMPELPEGLKRIGSWAFQGCASFVEVVVPEEVVAIASKAFYGCQALARVSLAEYVTEIASDAFIGCSDNFELQVAANSCAEKFATEHGIPYTYTMRDNAALDVRLSSTGDFGDYAGCMLRVLTGGRERVALRVSDAQTVHIAGLKAGESCSVEMCDRYGHRLAGLEGISLLEGDNTCDLALSEPPSDVCAAVLDARGADVTGQVELTWQDADTGATIQRGAVLSRAASGARVTLRCKLTAAYATLYAQPADVTCRVSESGGRIDIRLVPLAEKTLRGTVVGADGGLPISGATVAVIQYFGGTSASTFTCSTDASGAFALTVRDVKSDLCVSAPEYIDRTLSYAAVPEGDVAVELAPFRGYKIALNAVYTRSHALGEETVSGAEIMPWADAAIAVYNRTKASPVADFVLRIPDIVILSGADAGDELEIALSSKSQAFVEGRTSLVLADSQADSVALNLLQRGNLRIVEQPADEYEDAALIFDGTGALVQRLQLTERNTTSGSLPDGNYTLVVLKSGRIASSVRSWSDLGAIGLVARTHYQATEVTIAAGQTQVVTLHVTPALDDSSFSYVASASFTAGRASGSVGKYVTLRAQASMLGAYAGASNLRWKIVVPDGCELVSNSVQVEGKAAAFAMDGGAAVVGTDAFDKPLRVTLVPQRAGDYRIGAYLLFDVNGVECCQALAPIAYQAQAFSFVLPEKTGSTENTASGKTYAGAKVSLYVDGVMAGNTVADFGGAWAVGFEVPAVAQSHEVYAVVQMLSGIPFESEVKYFRYVPNYISVSRVTMLNTAHTATSMALHEYETVFDFQHPTSSTPYYLYWPSYPTFTFLIDFSNNDPVQITRVLLTVYTDKGNEYEIPAEYNASQGRWVAAREFVEDDLPVSVAVTRNAILTTMTGDNDLPIIVRSGVEPAYNDSGLSLKDLTDMTDYNLKSCLKNQQAVDPIVLQAMEDELRGLKAGMNFALLGSVATTVPAGVSSYDDMVLFLGNGMINTAVDERHIAPHGYSTANSIQSIANAVLWWNRRAWKEMSRSGCGGSGDPQGGDAPTEYPRNPSTAIRDPSGYAYEAVTSNRLEGVTATCYRKETLTDDLGEPYESVSPWDATLYGQENPLTTDGDGSYAWDVPTGAWQVRFDKDGYETAYSNWMDVPPPRFDVNVGMVSYEQPSVSAVRAYTRRVEITFSKYMTALDLSSANIRVLVGGQAVAGSIELPDKEADPKNAGWYYASKAVFVPDVPFEAGGQVTVQVSSAVRSYAKVRLAQDYSGAATTAVAPSALQVDAELKLTEGAKGTIALQVLPQAAGAGQAVTVSPATARLFGIGAQRVVLDDQGRGEVRVTALVAGTSAIDFVMEASGLSATTKVVIAMGNTPESVAKPQASISGAVNYGTSVVLTCATEGATIYYSLDGTCPCDEATRLAYVAPIVIRRNCTLLAVAVKEGMEDSAVARYAYTAILDTVSGITLTARSHMLGVGGVMAIKAVVLPESSDPTLTYTSSNPAIATVDAQGKVTGVKAGKCVVTATAADGGGASAGYDVTVGKYVTSIALTAPTALGSGRSASVGVTVLPKTAAKRTLKWTVSPTGAATVSSGGTVKARGVAVATRVTVTATAVDGSGVSATREITIYPVATGVAIAAPRKYIDYLAQDRTLALTVAVSPANAFQEVNWKSSDSRIATVNAGMVTALKPGTVTITAAAKDGSGKSAKVTISVVKAVQGLSIVGAKELAAGKSTGLGVAFTPADATNRGVIWSIKGSAASVSTAGKVTAKKTTTVQTVVVTAASAENPAISATREITIYPAATGVAIIAPRKYIDFLAQDRTLALTAAVTPANAFQEVNWKSSDSRIATVNAGMVTALKPGTVTITATAKDGSGKSAKVTISVVKAVRGLSIVGAKELASGKSTRLSAVFTPADATNRGVIWSIKGSAASVSTAGKVTAKKVTAAQTVVVTAASVENPTIIATLVITISP